MCIIMSILVLNSNRCLPVIVKVHNSIRCMLQITTVLKIKIFIETWPIHKTILGFCCWHSSKTTINWISKLFDAGISPNWALNWCFVQVDIFKWKENCLLCGKVALKDPKHPDLDKIEEARTIKLTNNLFIQAEEWWMGRSYWTMYIRLHCLCC